MKPKIVLIGLSAAAANYEKWPELSPEKLEAAFGQILQELTEAGYDPVWCLTDTGETAAAQVLETLSQHPPDIVLIGAGVRVDTDHFLLFEKVINLVHQHAPTAKICFNTSPFDSLAAVQRWST